LSVLCYRLSAGLVLNPLWVVTGEWSAPHSMLNSALFQGHGHTPWHWPIGTVEHGTEKRALGMTAVDCFIGRIGLY
jgi:hypothetical protein